MAARQVKIFTGVPPGPGGYYDDPVADSLGNSWIQSNGYGGGAGVGGGVVWSTASWYIPSTVNTVGGTLSFRGVAFDAPVLAGALCIAVGLSDSTGGETHLVLLEFGADAATFAYDYGSGSQIVFSSAVTSGIHASSTTQVVGVSTVRQVWIAVNSTGQSVTGATTPAEFTSVLDTGIHRISYRDATTPLTTSPAGAFTWTSPASSYQAMMMRFELVVPLAAVVSALPLLSLVKDNPWARLSATPLLVLDVDRPIARISTTPLLVLAGPPIDLAFNPDEAPVGVTWVEMTDSGE